MASGKRSVAKFHLAKLVRGVGPTFAMSGLLFFLLLGPFLRALKDDIVSRIEVAGPVALGLAGLVFFYWVTQIILMMVKGFDGIYILNQRLYFFEWKYSSVPVESISHIEVEKVSFQDKVCLRVRDGRRRVILTNLMRGGPEDIKVALSSALKVSE